MPKIVHCGLDYSGGGGGSGEANFIELSQEEYDELTYEEKHDPNKMYMISNSQEVEGQYFNPVIYSTEEREIGVWTDGKPLYQKTYVVTNVTSQGTRLDTISDIDRLVDFSGTFNRILNGNKTLYELDGRTESANYNNYGCGWNVDNNGAVNVTFYGYSVSEIESLSATIQYTKTTDVPGSGQYTTLGVPAVHYDDTERIIGTWFGETLYQKTVTGTLSNSSNSTNIFNFAANNVKEIIDCKGKVGWINTYGDTAERGLGGYDNDNSYSSWGVNSSETEVLINYGNYMKNQPYKITLEYTKTTS